MGNEQSQEVSSDPETGSSTSRDDFDLSQIEDTRRDHQSSPVASPPAERQQAATPPPQPPPAAASPLPQPPTPKLSLSPQPVAQPAASMTSRKRKTKTKANSKKKRHQDLDVIGEDMEVEKQAVETEHEETGAREEARLAGEMLSREQSQRIRRMEPEMFDEYAMSEDSIVESLIENAEPTGVAIVEMDVEEPEQIEPLPEEEPEAEATGGEETSVDDIENADEILPEAHHASPDPPESVQTDEGIDMDVDADANEKQLQAAELTPERNISSDRTTTMNSIFDGSMERDVVAETPMVKQNKRKRVESATPESARKVYKNKKRRNETPPTSPEVDATMFDVQQPPATKATERVSKTAKGIRRQSSMEQFAVPYIKGSNFVHPVYNPLSADFMRPRHRVEVVIPVSHAGPSTAPDKSLPNGLPTEGSSAATPALRRRGRNATPATEPSRQQNMWDVHDQPEGLGKTVAKRTMGQGGDGDDPGSSSSEDDYNENGDDNDPEEQQKKNKKHSKGKERARSASPQPRKRSKPDRTSGSRRKSRAKDHQCTICNVAYATEALLDKHLDDPGAHDHLQTCGHCGEPFTTRAALLRHAKNSGHGASATGATGRFSTEEEETILRWRDQICHEYGFNLYEFNEVMTASTKKGKEAWPYKFMSKVDFQKEYYAVLPDRDRRSMQRHRFKFQNVDKSRDFTEEDDADILRLVEELGPRWTEIADSLTRDVEAVRQRYKNKLSLSKDLKGGVWQDDERERFDAAIKEVRRLTTTSEKDLNESTFNWSAVSHKVKSRSAKQCADHWRAKHGKNVKGLWVDAGTSLLLRPKSPSKMEQRLNSGELSAKYVGDSDDEEESARAQLESSAKALLENAAADKTNEDEAVEQATPSRKSRKPTLADKKTPNMTATQAFEGTQAHTSGLKASSKRKRRRSGPSQEQPSPGLAIQSRPDRNPEFDRKLERLLAGEDTEEEDDQQAKSRSRKRKQKEPVREPAEDQAEDSEDDEENPEEVPDDQQGDGEQETQEGAEDVGQRRAGSRKAAAGAKAKGTMDRMFNSALNRKEVERKRKTDKKNMKAGRWPEESDSGSDVDVEADDGLPP